ncbi:MAG: hypothetical protein ACM3II_15875 [Rhodospirillaceae bacterium]
MRKTQQFVWGLFAALCLMAVPTAAFAVLVQVQPQPSAYAAGELAGATLTLRIAGPIERGDAEIVRDQLMRLTGGWPDGGLLVAETSGSGSDYREAMRIGQILRDFRVVTVVRRGEECASACVLVFLGGTGHQYAADGTPMPRRYLEVGADLHFHNYFPRRAKGEPAPGYPVQALIDYSVRMGVDRRFTARLSEFAPDAPVPIRTVADFMLIHACPIGLARPTAGLQQQAANICNNASQWFDPDGPHRIDPITVLTAKRVLLDAARENAWRSRDDKDHDLGQRLSRRLYMESDEATDRLYGELNAAGISFPDLSGTIFEVSGYRTGRYGMECLIGFPESTADRYTALVASRVSSWLAPMVREVQSACPDLLRHDGKEIINPPPRSGG